MHRVARLHDSIKQQIFRINISAATCEQRLESNPAGARAALEDVRRGAREAMARTFAPTEPRFSSSERTFPAMK